MAARQHSDARGDGQSFGQSSTDLIGFYGKAPIVRPTAAVAVNTTASTSTTNAFGFTTSTQADAIVTAVNALIANLTALGLQG